MSLDSVLFVCLLCFVESFKYNTLKDLTQENYPTDATVIDRTCTMKADEGPCRANLEMFHFEPSSMNCSKFRWGGCQGNGNRFNTYRDCMSRCVGVRGQKVRPNWCSLSFDYGYCFGQLERWYYDPLFRVCKQRTYSGCGGNRNNFLSKEQCSDACIYMKRELTDFKTSVNNKNYKNKKPESIDEGLNLGSELITNMTKNKYNITVWSKNNYSITNWSNT